MPYCRNALVEQHPFLYTNTAMMYQITKGIFDMDTFDMDID